MHRPSLRSTRASRYTIRIITFSFPAYVLFSFYKSLKLSTASVDTSTPSYLPFHLLVTQNISTHSNDWNPPSSSDPQLHAFKRDNQFTKEQLQYPWYRPLVYLHSTRPSYWNPSKRVVYLYSQGITLGGVLGYERNFTAVGCLVGSNVYPLASTSGDETYVCMVPIDIPDGEFLSVVIQGDEYLQKALTMQPIRLKYELTVALQPGDINAVPDNYYVFPKVRSQSEGMKLYYARSLVRWQPGQEMIPVSQRKEKTRYEICGCTENKLYPHLTEPWVDYHRRIGMDFIFLIDNNAPVDLQEMVVNRSDVKVFFWPYAKSQIKIWSYILQFAVTKCEWLFFFDPDEYLMFGIGKSMEYATRRPLKIYTNKLRRNGTVAVSFGYTMLDSSEQLNIPDDPPPKVYVHASIAKHNEGKMMIYTDYPWARARIHRHYDFHNRVPNQGFLETRRGIIAKPVDINDEPTLIHFKRRSWEELQIKMGSERSTLNHAFNFPRGGPGKLFYLRKKSDALRYTHFKSIWEAVTEKADMNFQTLVRSRDGKRCTAVIRTNSKSVVEETCEDIGGEKEDA